MSQIPVPFRTRVISGTIGQLDLMGAGYFGANSQCSAAERIQFNYQLVLIICIVAHSILDSSAATAAMTDEVVSGLILRADGAGGGAIVRPSSISTLQAIGLSLQLLSGKYQAPTSLDMPLVMSELYQQLLDALPKRIFPSLLTDALVRVIIPTWSFSDTVAHARMEDIKPLTALILMCTGALSTKECTELSMGAEFSRAIPQFLDAPTPLVRLSGIIVADCIVSSAHLAKRNTATQEGDGSDKAIDFGLDEIIRDAQTTTQPIIKASADYILETRRFAHPIEQQWAEANNCAADNSSRDSNAESSCKGEATAEAISFMRAYNGIDGAADSSAVYAPRQSSLTAEPDLSSRFVKPRAPVFLRDCLGYLKSQKDDSTERAQIGLYALANCIEKSNIKTVEELWLLVANKVLYMYNRGPEDLDWAWDMERRKSLVALTIKLPELLGPFLADRSCDRNLTLKDREIVFSAIATACLQLAGLEVPHALSAKQGSAQAGIVEVAPQEHANTDVDKAGENMGTSALVGAGTVVRRSRRLDLVAAKSSSSSASGAASGHLQAAQRKYASIVGPAFFFPLISQYGKSDMSTAISDIRDDASQLERYINTLAVMLYTGGSASHQITMNREFWDLAKLVRCIPGAKHVNESPPVLDALLFGIDVILSPERALSTPTLAREFRADIADMVQWINGLAEQGILGQSAMVHAARIVSRLQEIQGDVYRRATSNDINKFTSLF
ncbi:TEL2, telomere maintenance protein 2 [Coemansia sp. RSA 2322]|nr:TEL2, telomere maintenance protein 2 [Coemansia sp. RSA 2322]KAJ2483359.1 TEL2, telomere maintenance protein 2 [Coemansia sp. RSA 2320]